MSEEKLFAVYLGGRADKCNIELHDVVFVVATTIEESYSLLARKWFGNLDGFHIDSYQEIKQVDGFEVSLSKSRPAEPQENKLFFINLGAYRHGEFTEVHKSEFYVATSAPNAVRRAKEEFASPDLHTIHKDDVIEVSHVANDEFDVDDVIELDEVDQFFITLKPAMNQEKNEIQSAYIKLDKELLRLQ